MQVDDVDKRLSHFLAGLHAGYKDVYLQLACIDTDGRVVSSSDAAQVGQQAVSRPAWLSIITSFGRNVAPEWVESELVSHPGIAQAALFGEARPFNCAVMVPHPGAQQRAIEAALEEPDYAQVRAWIPATEPFTVSNGMSAPNGVCVGPAILGKYAAQIDALYPETELEPMDFYPQLQQATAAAVRASRPDFDTDVMVAYAYDTVMRRNPVGFFGMVYVLERT